MAIAYQYFASGYFAGEVDDYSGPLPNNATYTAPAFQEGFIPRWNGTKWVQVENHIDEEGYLHGQPHTIKEYGPYPDGWSTTTPEPTQEERNAQRHSEILARLSTIDFETVRPLRAIVEGTSTQGDKDKLALLEVEAEQLRVELMSISG